MERLALRSGLVPRPAAEAYGGLALAGVLIAAVELGIPARLERGPVTLAALADGLAPDAVELLVECLVSAGYLHRTGDVVALTVQGRRWLAPRGSHSMAAFVAACADYGPWWSRLADVVRTGRPVGHHEAAPDDAYWRRYELGQRDLARLSADEVARHIRLGRGPRRVLDIGGGHGSYTIALCRGNPGLRATVLDLPGAVAVGTEVVTAAGLAERIDFRTGDAREVDFGTGYDAVLCFNLIHHLDPAEIVRLFRRAAGALAPGGRLHVLDGFAPSGGPHTARRNRPGGRGRDPAAAYTALFMYLTSGSRLHTHEEMRGFLASSGLHRVSSRAIRRMPGLSLYSAMARPSALLGDAGAS